MSGIARRLGGVLFVALAVVPVASSPAGAHNFDRRLYVIGDSVLLGAKDQIAVQLDGWDVTVDSFVGLNMPTAIKRIGEQLPNIGDLAVIGLGNNYFGNRAAFAGEVDQVMSLLHGVKHVVWLTVRVFQPHRAAVNEVLRETAQRWPNLELADWDPLPVAHPEYVYGDGLHLTPKGRVAYAALIDQVVTEWDERQGPFRPRVYAFGGVAPIEVPDTVVSATPIVGMAVTSSGAGYWLVASDGGVFGFGDARFAGSRSGLDAAERFVAVVANPSGQGYRLAGQRPVR